MTKQYEKRKAEGLCLRCGDKPSPPYKECLRCVAYAYSRNKSPEGKAAKRKFQHSDKGRLRDREEKARRKDMGLCSSCGTAPSNGWAVCLPCYTRIHERAKERMSEQDLSKLASYTFTDAGLRTFSVRLPVPSWAKATRTYHRPGNSKPLTDAAKKYRDFINMSVIVSEPAEKPWLRGPFNIYIRAHYNRFDLDAHIGGLVDDSVKAGLMVDDRYWLGLTVEMIRCKRDEQHIIMEGREV